MLDEVAFEKMWRRLQFIGKDQIILAGGQCPQSGSRSAFSKSIAKYDLLEKSFIWENNATKNKLYLDLAIVSEVSATLARENFVGEDTGVFLYSNKDGVLLSSLHQSGLVDGICEHHDRLVVIHRLAGTSSLTTWANLSSSPSERIRRDFPDIKLASLSVSGDILVVSGKRINKGTSPCVHFIFDTENLITEKHVDSVHSSTMTLNGDLYFYSSDPERSSELLFYSLATDAVSSRRLNCPVIWNPQPVGDKAFLSHSGPNKFSIYSLTDDRFETYVLPKHSDFVSFAVDWANRRLLVLGTSNPLHHGSTLRIYKILI